MKIKIVFVIYFVLFIKTLLAQEYVQFPDSNAIWRENTYGYQCSCCSDYQYIISGDTIINSNTYHKIYKSGVQYAEDFQGYCTNNIIGYFNNYYGAFRNDSLNKKVYGIRYDINSDTLLYDFNLSLGDTLPESLLNDTAYFNYVTNIDSILIGNKYHKRYEISSNYTGGGYVYLIEGIGSTFGLFSFLMPPFEMNSTLLCFNQDEQTVYPNSSYNCELITNDETIINKNIKINIYPNPVNTSFIIKFFPDTSSDFYLYNIFGKKVLRYNNLKNNTLIEKGDLSSGLYFYKIIVKNSTLTGKLVIN